MATHVCDDSPYRALRLFTWLAQQPTSFFSIASIACGLVLLAAAVVPACAEGTGVIVSRYSKSEFALAPDPDAPQWKGVPGVFAENGPLGQPVPGHRTEIRSRWTDQNLYFLFLCPYRELHLKPNPVQKDETNHLWDWDVAEVFVGLRPSEEARWDVPSRRCARGSEHPRAPISMREEPR